MAIPQSQLETWAKPGAAVGSRDTYAAVCRALEASGTGYSARTYEIFLQGSYGNDTNIWSESDVDVIIRLDSIYFYDTSDLNPLHLQQFNATFVLGDYSYYDYKSHVKAALESAFGTAFVSDGKKAFKIKPSGNRRSADVVAAALFRRYSSGLYGMSIEPGICCFDSSGNQIVNYPDQHSDNCTKKNQSTGGRFKPMVRVFKNMRSRLVNEGIIADGIAPSYYIEGLLHNVPSDKFQTSLVDTVADSVNWIVQANRAAFRCANQQYLLFGNTAVQWPEANYEVFINELIKMWNNWR